MGFLLLRILECKPKDEEYMQYEKLLKNLDPAEQLKSLL